MDEHGCICQCFLVFSKVAATIVSVNTNAFDFRFSSSDKGSIACIYVQHGEVKLTIPRNSCKPPAVVGL